MSDNIRDLVNLDPVIHQPTRLLITSILYSVEEADFLYMLRETELTKGNLSAHLSKLEDAGYVEIEKTFVGKITRTVYRMTKDGRRAYSIYRQQMRGVFDF